VAQLEDDTWYDFEPAVVLAEEIDTAAELAAWDVVILGDSGYNTADWTQFDAELEAWVLGGGGLVVTGYAAVGTVCLGQSLVAGLLPVTCDSTTTIEATVTVTAPGHPVTDEFGGLSLGTMVTLDTSASLAVDGLGLAVDMVGSWAVAVREAGLGRVVYLAPVYMGASYYGTGFLRDGDADLLLEEAVAWAGGCVDADGDGGLDWHCGGDDCDDDDPTRYAGAVELCNAVDDDCDGVVPVDELDDDGDGLAECEGDCNDGNAALNLDDADGDGYTSCDGDCDDADPSWNLDDLDGDGFSNCTGDCDESNPFRFPGAPEVCNDIDDDCNGVVPPNETDDDVDGYAECQGDCDDSDEELNPFDVDQDGWSTCYGDCDDHDPLLNLDDADGDGWDTCAGDCDDGDASSAPDGIEICDGRDNDCDGVLDDVDDDGDGFIDADCGGDDCDDHSPTLVPTDGDGDGWSPCGGDCDDLRASTYPGAAEDCHNGFDDDCDGMIDGRDSIDCPDEVVEPSNQQPAAGCGACDTTAVSAGAPAAMVWWIAATGWLVRRRRA
jgi:Putative metal-binding motif